MAVTAETLETAQYRLARYYLSKLRAAEATYQHGHEHSTDALTQFDKEWSQIKQWRDWSAEHSSDHDEIADLCMEYPQAGAELFLLRQHPRERLEWLEAGLAAARRLGDPRAEMVHLFMLGRTHMNLGAFSYALDFAEQALAQQVDAPLYVCKSLRLLGGIFYGIDEYERARVAHEQALAISKELDAKLEIGLALNGLGNVALSQSDNERAYDYYSQYLEISEANGQPQDICLALGNLSIVTKRMGDDRAATLYAERSVALCRAVGNQRQLTGGLAQLGDLASARGNLSEARDYYQQSLDVARLISHRSEEAHVLNRLGNLLCRLGELPASLECLEASLSVANKIEERWFSALALMTMAEVFRLMGDIHRACLKLREGLDIACTMQSSAIQAKYVLEAALLWHDQGQSEQAALWIGLLHEHVSKLTAEQRTAYDDLHRKLEVELDQGQFSASIECGKTLDLDSVIQEILRELSSI